MAKIGTLSDNFNDNSIDTALWDTYTDGGSTITEQNQRLEFGSVTNSGSGYAHIRTDVNYDWTDSNIAIDMAQVVDQHFSHENMFIYVLDTDSIGWPQNYEGWYIANGMIKAAKSVANSFTSLWETTYSATTHRWLRIRHAGSTLYLDTAPSTASNPPTSAQWVNRWSGSPAHSVTSKKLHMSMGAWDAGHGADTGWVDTLHSTSSAHTLTGANSSQANTSGTGAVTQVHILTGAGSSQANTSGTGAVSQVHALVGANSSQANSSGTGAVSQVHALVGANSSQANTSGTGAVTQVHALVGANSSQANESSTGAIHVAKTLTIADSSQANTSSTGAVVVAHNLVVTNSSQASTSGTGVVSQVHALVGANSSQSNTSSSEAIVVPIFLTVPASSQANTSGTGAVVVAHNLLVASSSQVNTCNTIAVVSRPIPPYVSFKDRVYAVSAADRVYRIETADRVYRIESDNRVHVVESANRTVVYE